jgi:hypothetical protein
LIEHHTKQTKQLKAIIYSPGKWEGAYIRPTLQELILYATANAKGGVLQKKLIEQHANFCSSSYRLETIQQPEEVGEGADSALTLLPSVFPSPDWIIILSPDPMPMDLHALQEPEQ